MSAPEHQNVRAAFAGIGNDCFDYARYDGAGFGHFHPENEIDNAFLESLDIGTNDKWIVDRVHGRAHGKETPIGWTPHFEDLHWDGLDFTAAEFDELERVDRTAWTQEVLGHEELFIALHNQLPPEMIYERELLICRL